MANYHVNIDFSRISQPKFAVLVQLIITSLSNAVLIFVAPIVPIATLKLQLKAYTDILGMAKYPGKKADLAAARLVIETSLKTNGEYVDEVALGDFSEPRTK